MVDLVKVVEGVREDTRSHRGRPEDVNVSVLVAEGDAERAVHSLHREFFYKSAAEPSAEEKSNQKGSGGRKNPKGGAPPR